MKLEKFPKRIKSIISEFNELENKKRYRIIISLGNNSLVASRLEYNDNTNEAHLKYSAQSKKSFLIKPEFIEKISDIQIEKINVIRKKLHLKAPIKKRVIKRDERGIPIKRIHGLRKNRELSELEFKAMFDERFISTEVRDELFDKKNLFGGMEIPKRAFKKIKPEFQDVVSAFLEQYVDLNTITDGYKRDNYGGLSLIVGKNFVNMNQTDPRFRAYKTVAITHRAGQGFITFKKISPKSGVDTFYYLINPTTLVQVNKSARYRNRG